MYNYTVDLHQQIIDGIAFPMSDPSIMSQPEDQASNNKLTSPETKRKKSKSAYSKDLYSANSKCKRLDYMQRLAGCELHTVVGRYCVHTGIIHNCVVPYTVGSEPITVSATESSDRF